MNLPNSEHLQIDKLSSVFSSTSSTYKFYWFLAILELVEEGNTKIEKQRLFSRMISNSWHTVNYFHVSFGKQDLIQDSVKAILNIENITINENRNKINAVLENTHKIETIKILNHFDKNVPHWFISSWFTGTRSEIYSLSQNFEHGCIYRLGKDYIEINPVWVSYLQFNSKILKDFCFWNLSLFLQKRNPNVPDIPNKISKSITRNSLVKQTNEYWKIVFNELGAVDCIFTSKKLIFEEKKYALDHFIPHAFVSHDLIWNLIPIDKTFNSSKGDKLPSVKQYFDKFYNLQKTAYEIVKTHNSKNKYLEEYLSVFPDLEGKNGFDYLLLKETVQPLITIASNNGFSFMKDL
ncbi:HNH endonuclease domain-containing protein [Flavobacterium sp. LHD-80]|uniref:HNH endonuclease domain-containing protein n=1 Tax=Flavobacterium sp. LHD-80 TaxID=3071411 RepID=UPI0027DFED3C|nr:HNH endonuclease domain-containing protein [Flavobacterium sp. LHD-80]MDQ6471912.1 HNH endonuclease domain-containing protein [Flavobacterium sp. LHD-80]